MNVFLVVKPRKRYGFWRFMLDLTLTYITGGLWLLWLFIKFLRSNTR